MAKQVAIETAKASVDALHAKLGVVNGRAITLGKLWNVLGTRWTWCERLEPVGNAVPYRIEGKYQFDPVYQPA